MATLSETSSLLLFRVGPVLCCAPSLAVSSIILPPTLTHPPGSNLAKPGIFKHSGHIVTSLDLRYQYGVEQSAWVQPGRMIIANLQRGHVGFWVDEILEVIEQPMSGWGPLPALLPVGIFSRTLLLENEIYLYADFEALYKIPRHGYLRGYIQQLIAEQERAQATQTNVTHAAVRESTSARLDSNATATAHAQESERGTSKSLPLSVKPMNKKAPTHADSNNQTCATRSNQTTAPQIKSQLHKSKPRSPVVARSSDRAAVKTLTKSKPTQTTTPASTITNTSTQNLTGNTSANTSVTASSRTQTKLAPLRTSRSQPPTETARAAQPQTNESTLAIWLFACIFIALLAGTGWTVWFFTQPDQDKLITTPTSKTAITPESTDRQHTALSATAKDSLAMNSETYASQSSPATEARPDSESADAGIKIEDSAPTPYLTADTSSDMDEIDSDPAESIQHDTQYQNNEQVTANKNTTTAYNASIEQAADGLTIVIDAPDDVEVFKARETVPVETASESAPVDANEVRSTASDNQPSSPPTQTPKHLPKPANRSEVIHIVVKGDTLWHIASRYLNNPFLYPELARLSNIENPDLIYPGNRVRIVKRRKKSDN